MPYEVPKSKASIRQNRFEFTIPGYDETVPDAGPDGETVTRPRVVSLPKLKFLKPHLIAALEGSQKLTAMLNMLDEYYPGVRATDGSWERVPLSHHLDDGEQIGALYNAWAEDSGLTLGESSASTDS